MTDVSDLRRCPCGKGLLLPIRDGKAFRCSWCKAEFSPTVRSDEFGYQDMDESTKLWVQHELHLARSPRSETCPYSRIDDDDPIPF